MGELALLAAAGIGTALATGLGAVPVFALGVRADALRPLLWGLAAGVMTVASVVGLLAPALDAGSPGTVAGGLLAGVLFLVVGRRLLERRDVHVGALRGAGVRRSVLVFGVLLVHSLPEGFAIGTAFASEQTGLGLFVLLAIAVQNIPEGTTSAIPMRDAGFTSDQRSAAGRRGRGLPPRRGVRGAAARLVRLRGGRDARARAARARSAGVHPRHVADGARGRGRRRRRHARPERRDRRVTLRRTTDPTPHGTPMWRVPLRPSLAV
jgi:hypothetical protein